MPKEHRWVRWYWNGHNPGFNSAQNLIEPSYNLCYEWNELYNAGIHVQYFRELAVAVAINVSTRETVQYAKRGTW